MNGFSPNMLCALIWFGIANGQISSDFDRVICPRHVHIFVFRTITLGKCQGILTKLGTCLDIKEIWFRIAYGQILSILTELSAHDKIIAGYHSLTLLFFRKILNLIAGGM